MNLVELLLYESSEVVVRVELDLDLDLYPENYENKRLQLNKEHQKFQKEFRQTLFEKMEQHKTESNFIRKNIA